ncbi:lmo0937 family membrane protein [Mariniflexile sp.]|uniref:lmo0937 family membrane protein n=1 Tax=Mariniflexile sp. TaxID=1979402 RepID=UPI00356B2A39
MKCILWFTAAILIFVWILGVFGFIAGIATGVLIHFLLVIALIVIIYNIMSGRKSSDKS